MPTPQVYYHLHEEHEALKALAFKLLMSDEIPSVTGPHASALFDAVGHMTENEVNDALRALEATRTN